MSTANAVGFWQWENHLTYSTVIAEDHSINAMIGAEYQKYHRSRMEQTGADLSDDFFSWNNLGQAKTQSIASVIWDGRWNLILPVSTIT